jgi:hypothetical protein
MSINPIFANKLKFKYVKITFTGTKKSEILFLQNDSVTCLITYTYNIF